MAPHLPGDVRLPAFPLPVVQVSGCDLGYMHFIYEMFIG
jgi:hypothetical protein